MLSSSNREEKELMMNYYRTSDMLNLLLYFPELSPIRDLTIIESEEDYLKNKDYFDTFTQSRIDTIKSKPLITGIESTGKSSGFIPY